ncbi:ABC transporter permease subunit [Pseudomonas chlororaphis]|uniref:ABC transporter permease subunit n=1 Tax=Pseudomonas chlororaphis TaxID=587753 RepID=UPI002407F753|nr:hypothetical protein [Pseudomonas chlororaphis]
MTLTTALATPSSTRAHFGLLLFTLALVLAPGWSAMRAATPVPDPDFALLYIMLALGLNIVVGYAGLLDMGFIAFYAVGATSRRCCPRRTCWRSSGPGGGPAGRFAYLDLADPALAALLAAGCGLVLGAPTLRLRGDYLAIVTLGFGEIIRIPRNLDRPVNLTNGPKGIAQVDPKCTCWGSTSAAARSCSACACRRSTCTTTCSPRWCC